jgi:hypothetical protein|tara:strand:- start:9225 stop:10037 length:813 start_codon:yes stop_codon:yes gene_type:complete
MNYLKVLGSVIVLTILAGCSDPKIDASSDEAMKVSVEKVRESLPQVRRKEFDEAIQVLAFSNLNMMDLLAEGASGAGNVKGKVRKSLDGKTGQQVIAEAERVRAERKERERQQALKEIRELEERRAKSESAHKQLQKFEIIRSRFYMREKEYMGNQPIIELTVENRTGQAISRAYFEGTLASPNRSVPWHKDTFNYSISGGLEPGEKAAWSLAPNMFSGWGKIEAPADAVFTVTVERLDGADGEPLYSKSGFDERKRQRLSELKKEYGVE